MVTLTEAVNLSNLANSGLHGYRVYCDWRNAEMDFAGQRLIRVKAIRQNIEDKQPTLNNSCPEDTMVISVEKVDNEPERWWVYIESSEFETVLEGKSVPEQKELPNSLVKAAYEKRPHL